MSLQIMFTLFTLPDSLKSNTPERSVPDSLKSFSYLSTQIMKIMKDVTTTHLKISCGETTHCCR